ncbi:MAG TPA: methyltransferase domain-containing protein [Polyangia bacterium]|nr:methyltransferase domain-containing protein [Polyangia bacterium]
MLCVGIGDGAGIEVLLRRGARHVIGLTSEPQAIAPVQERLEAWRGRFELHTGTVRSLPNRFDVVLVSDALQLAGAGPGASWQEVLNALCQHVQPEGWLVAAARAVEGGGNGEGVGYYELADALADDFPAVTMLGQTPLHGVALAPFGEDEVEPVLDAGLVEPGLPSIYVAVAGPRRLTLGYGVVLLPPEAVEEVISTAPAARPEPAREPGFGAAERAELAELRAQQEQTRLELRRLEDARAELTASRERMEVLRREYEQRLAQEAGRRAEAEGQLAARERAVEELREAGLQHAREMQQMRSALDERDAYIAELEQGGRTIEPLRAQLREASARTAEAESKERAARRRAAELEGMIMRLERERTASAASAAPAPAAPVAPAASAAPSASVSGLEQQVAELRTQLEKQKTRADELQREAWAHLKARSEAEASAAEVREDTVRKLKDARKVANLELMRAMEEATKKAVALKEELVRCERERKEALAALKQAREQGPSDDLHHELERLRAENTAVGGERDRLLQTQQEAERELGALRAVREELGRAQAALGELRAQQAGARSQGGQGPGATVGGGPAGAADPQELARLHETLLRVERRNGELEEELARVRLALLRMPPDLQIAALEQRNRELEDEVLQLHRRLEPALPGAAEGSGAGFGHAGHNDSRRGELERMETTLEREMARLGMIEEGLRRVGEAIAAAPEGARPFNGEPE